MNVVVVLGFRRGLDEAIARRGMRPFYVVEKVKPELAGRDHVRVCRLEDAQEVLRAVRARGIRQVRAVVTTHEEGVFTAALLRRYFGTPGDHDYARTLPFRDKFLQKQALPAGVPRARCRYVADTTPFAELEEELGLPFVVKPANGYGSARTSVISSAEEFTAYWQEGVARSDVQSVAESFVVGDEVHVDGVWQDGDLAWSSVSRYVEALGSWTRGTTVASGPVASEVEPELHRQLEQLTRTTLSALDAPATVFHLEAFVTPGQEPTFGECAIRLVGGMAPEGLELTYGMNLYDATLSLALGERPELPDPDRTPERYFGWILLRSFPGVHLGEDDFRAAFDLQEISFDPAGRVGAYGRRGYAIVGHSDSRQTLRLIKDIIEFSRTGVRPVARVGGSAD